MLHLPITITYHDGKTEDAVAEHAELAAYELYALRQGIPPIVPGREQSTPALTMLFLGYAAKHRGKPRGEWPAFDDWIVDVREVLPDETAEMGGDAETQVFPTVRSAG